MILDIITGVIILAIITTLVRPNSPAASAIKTISGSFASIIGVATGYNAERS